MNSLVGAGAVTPSARDVSPLPHPARTKENLRANGIPRTLPPPHQFEGDPVIVALHHIAEQRRSGIHVVQDDVYVAIVEEVPERSTSCGDHISQAAASRGRNLLKLNAIKIAEKLWPLGPGCAPVPLVHRWVDVPVSYKYVREPIVIKVQEPGSPSKE